jgi:hypothetical protein
MKKYDYITADTIFVISNDEVRALISEKFDFKKCKKLNTSSYKLINSYPDILKYKKNEVSFI